MNKVASILRLDFVPLSTDAGLLVLRLWWGFSMLVLHGWSKLTSFQQMADKFPDPLNVGTRTSLILALVGEVLCPILLVLGLFTGLAALVAAITMAVAFFIVHKSALSGPGSGEMAYLYMAGFIVLFIAGSGRFALDGKGAGPRKSRASKE